MKKPRHQRTNATQFHLHEAPTVAVKFIETEETTEVARGREEGMDTNFQSGEMKSFRRWMVAMAAQH